MLRMESALKKMNLLIITFVIFAVYIEQNEACVIGKGDDLQTGVNCHEKSCIKIEMYRPHVVTRVCGTCQEVKHKMYIYV